MRIAYINHGRFPTEKAYGFQIAQVCDAMTELGHEVTVFSPMFRNSITDTPTEYYDLRHPLKVERVEHFDAFQSSIIPGVLGFMVSMWSYGKAVQKQLKNSSFNLVYLRSPLLLTSVLRLNISVILELHALPRFFRRRFVRACNCCKKVVCLTTPMRKELVAWGVDTHKVAVEADGVDLHRFEELPSISAAKTRWALRSDRPVIGYVGSLVTRETMEKGVRDMIDAIAEISAETSTSPLTQRPLFWIVGGPQKWVTLYQQHAAQLGLTKDDVRFEGRIDAAAVPSAIVACDICVYPAPKTNHPYFLRDTSPLKLFEYLAAGRPVVCADLPPVRDVVDERSMKFCIPGDPQSLADAIQDVLAHPEQAAARVKEGLRIVQEHSWEKRMQRILGHISDTVKP